MNRRTIIAGIGWALVGTSAGCLGSQAPPAAPTSDSPASPSGESILTVLSRECGRGEDRASIRFEDGLVRIDGVITGANTCETAELESVTLEGSSLRVSIETVPPETGTPACGQCLTDIEYRVVVRDADITPEEVVVVHDGSVVSQGSRSS